MGPACSLGVRMEVDRREPQICCLSLRDRKGSLNFPPEEELRAKKAPSPRQQNKSACLCSLREKGVGWANLSRAFFWGTGGRKWFFSSSTENEGRDRRRGRRSGSRSCPSVSLFTTTPRLSPSVSPTLNASTIRGFLLVAVTKKSQSTHRNPPPLLKKASPHKHKPRVQSRQTRRQSGPSLPAK